MENETHSTYDLNLFQFIYCIASDVETYVEKFHTHLPDNSEEVLGTNLDDDLIGFLFEERNDILKQKMVSTILLLNTEMVKYLKHIRLLIQENSDKEFVSSESFYKSSYEKINKIIHQKNQDTKNPDEMMTKMISFDLIKWVDDQINQINSIGNIEDRKLLKMENILMVFDEFSYFVIQALKVCKSSAENSMYPHEAFSYFKYAIKIILYTIEFVDSIEIK